MEDENKKRFKIMQELKDMGCIPIKDNKGRNIDVCVGTDTDMGHRKATIFQNNKVNDFDSVNKMLKSLKNVAKEELQKARSFVSESFRDAKKIGKSEEAEAKAFPFGSKYKKSEEKEV